MTIAAKVSIKDVLTRANLDESRLEIIDESGADHFKFVVATTNRSMRAHITSLVPQFARKLTKLETHEQAAVCEALLALVPEVGDSVVIEGSDIAMKKMVRVTRTKSHSPMDVHLLLTQ